MIILGMTLFLFGMMSGCKKKNEGQVKKEEKRETRRTQRLEKDKEVTEKETNLREKIKESQIAGRYFLELIDGQRREKEEGIWTFKRDGTISVNLSGKWETKKDRIKLYDEKSNKVKEFRIRGDTIEYGSAKTLKKREGAEIVKIFEVSILHRRDRGRGRQPMAAEPQHVRKIRQPRPRVSTRPLLPQTRSQPEPVAELKKMIVWSDYSFSEDDELIDIEDIKLIELKLKKNGRFSKVLLIGGKWKTEGKTVKLYADEEHELPGRVENDFMIFTYPAGEQFKFIKEGSELARKIEEEEKTKKNYLGEYVYNPSDPYLPRQIVTIEEGGSYRLDIDYKHSDVADTTITGKWEIVEGEIVLHGFAGTIEVKGEIKGNTLVDHLKNRIFVK